MAKRVVQVKRPDFDTISCVNDLGKIIQYERTKQNLTIEDLAGYSSMSTKTVSKLENGAVGSRVETFLKLANSLGLKLRVDDADA